MVENKPVQRPGSLEFTQPPNRRRYLRGFVVGAAALSFFGRPDAITPAQAIDPAPAKVAEATPPAITAEIGVKVTCDPGCRGKADGNYPLDQQLVDISRSGIKVVYKSVNLRDLVDVKGISKNYSSSNCTANSAYFNQVNLVQLDQIVNGLHSIGVETRIGLDMPDLASVDPRIEKCMAYGIAERYSGEDPNGPAAVMEFEIGNEPNDEESGYKGTAQNYAVTLEAMTRGIHAANKAARVAIGGLRSDGVGQDPGQFLQEVAAADPNPTFNKVNWHIYPPKNATGKQLVLLPGAQLARQELNAAWPDRAYYPGAQYGPNIQDQPFAIDINEFGWPASPANPGSMRVAAARNAKDMKAIVDNTLDVPTAMIFHWLYEPAGGWQTGVVHESGPGLNEAPVNRNTPMLKILARLTAEIKKSRNASVR